MPMPSREAREEEGNAGGPIGCHGRCDQMAGHARGSPTYVPAILEPDFDLLGLDVGENGAVFDELLAANGAGLGALVVDTLQCLHLLVGVTHILSGVVHGAGPGAVLVPVQSHSWCGSGRRWWWWWLCVGSGGGGGGGAGGATTALRHRNAGQGCLARLRACREQAATMPCST